MPLFHFHVYADVHARDEEGITLPDLDAAKAAALAGVRFLAINDIRTSGRICLSHRIEITDASGSLLQVVRYSDGVVVEA